MYVPLFLLPFHPFRVNPPRAWIKERDEVLKGVLKAAKRRSFDDWTAGEVRASVRLACVRVYAACPAQVCVWLEVGIGMGQYAARGYETLLR